MLGRHEWHGVPVRERLPLINTTWVRIPDLVSVESELQLLNFNSTHSGEPLLNCTSQCHNIYFIGEYTSYVRLIYCILTIVFLSSPLRNIHCFCWFSDCYLEGLVPSYPIQFSYEWRAQTGCALERLQNTCVTIISVKIFLSRIFFVHIRYRYKISSRYLLDFISGVLMWIWTGNTS